MEESTELTDRNLSQWKVVNSDKGGYILSIGGAHTAPIGKHLYAVLLHEPEAEHWKIEPYERGGDGVYM